MNTDCTSKRSIDSDQRFSNHVLGLTAVHRGRDEVKFRHSQQQFCIELEGKATKLQTKQFSST